MAVLGLLALPSAAAAETGGAGQFENPAVGSHSPFAPPGKWIWYVDQSQGGSVPAIVATAHRHQIGTVYVKAGDGTTTWEQFNPTLVAELHRGGLKVCAWQFVYGEAPLPKRGSAPRQSADGADCLVIDAEAQYEGKYAAADLYLSTLRAAIGANFPLSLAGFPYVDYHPAFPYSVFLGPGGATINQPQMYWKAIGTSVGDGLRPHLPLQPGLGAADLPDRPDLRSARAPAAAPLPPLLGDLRHGAELVGLAGDRRCRSGRRSGRRAATGRCPRSTPKSNTRC